MCSPDVFPGCFGFDLVVEDDRAKRETCSRCARPVSVCWCVFLPDEPLHITTTVHILQHPFEETRNLRTAPMLQLGLQADSCIVHRGQRFSRQKFPLLHRIAEDERTLLLYPGADAVDIEEMFAETSPKPEGPFNLILLDGTWPQALGLYQKNDFLRRCRRVMFTNSPTLRRYYPANEDAADAATALQSRYVIRTQPTSNTLSTVETAALAISVIENRDDVVGAFLKPLDALCAFQLQHGAVPHCSKEKRLREGSYEKKVSRKQANRLVDMAGGKT